MNMNDNVTHHINHINDAKLNMVHNFGTSDAFKK